MVFRGQDKWRTHPLLSQCYKSPLPGLKTAGVLFAAYLFMDYTLTKISNTHHGIEAPPKPKWKFTESNEFGDGLPEGRRLGGHH